MTTGLKVRKKVNSSGSDTLGKQESVPTSKPMHPLASQIITKYFTALGYFRGRAASF